MNDLNIAALQTARQANASGSRAAPTRGADDDAAADFDRVMARVAQRDAAAQSPDEPTARDDAQQPSDAPSASAAPVTQDDDDTADASIVAGAAAVAAAPPALVPAIAANVEAAAEEHAASVDALARGNPAATRAPHAPMNAGPQSEPAIENASAPPPAASTAEKAPQRAARTTPPVAAQVDAADARARAAIHAAPAAEAIERAAAAVERRFEPTPAGTHHLARADAAGAPSATLATFAPQAVQTYSIAHARVATPVLQPGFGEELANRVVFLAGQRVQSAEIALTPADLGPLSVTIEVRGNEAHLFFGAAHGATRAAIEDALPRLREMFAGSGLQLADAQVGDHGRRDFARPQRTAGEAMRAIGSAGVATDALRPTRTARPDRLIDVVV